jgi:hypothetical protein
MTASTALAQTYNVNNVSYFKPTFLEMNRTIDYDLPAQYNSSDGTVNKGTAKFFDVVFNLSNIPVLNDNIALFAHVTDPAPNNKTITTKNNTSNNLLLTSLKIFFPSILFTPLF